MTHYIFRADQEIPSIPVEWRDTDNALIDFSSGYTFTVKTALVTTPNTTVSTATTGITGAATAPNVTIALSALSLAAKDGSYVAHLIARRTSDSADRVFSPGNPISFTVLPALT